MTVQILESARADLRRGYRFYERQGRGVGDYFLNTLFGEIDSLHLYAGIHSKIQGFFRMLSVKFPYAIYYHFQDDVAVVYAVLDCRRDPRRIARRLSQP